MKLNLKSKFQSNIARKFNNLNIKSILAHKKDLLAVRKKSRNWLNPWTRLLESLNLKYLVVQVTQTLKCLDVIEKQYKNLKFQKLETLETIANAALTANQKCKFQN